MRGVLQIDLTLPEAQCFAVDARRVAVDAILHRAQQPLALLPLRVQQGRLLLEPPLLFVQTVLLPLKVLLLILMLLLLLLQVLLLLPLPLPIVVRALLLVLMLLLQVRLQMWTLLLVLLVPVGLVLLQLRRARLTMLIPLQRIMQLEYVPRVRGWVRLGLLLSHHPHQRAWLLCCEAAWRLSIMQLPLSLLRLRC